MKITCAFGPFLPIPPIRGGAVERCFWSLCKEWAFLGHEVTIICREYNGMPPSCTEAGISIIRVPSFDAPGSILLYRCLDLLYALRVATRVPKSDITITHSVSLPLFVPKASAGKIYISVGRYPKGQMLLYSRADRLQAVSKAVADAICRQAPSMSRRVQVVPNCLSPQFAAATKIVHPRRNKEVLFVGRIAREKGIDRLIHAFATVARDFPAWRLTIVGPHTRAAGGDGDAYLEELREKAALLSRQIYFLAPIYDEKLLIKLYSRAEIFVYPSIAVKGESFGMAPLEAMSCGCATIVSNLECFEDYIAVKKNALVFDHRDVTGNSLSLCIRELMSNATFSRAVGEEGRNTARMYAPDSVARLFIDDFARLGVASDEK